MRPQTQETIADVRDDWKANLTSNFDTAKKLLDAIKPVEMPEVHGGGIGQKVFPVK